MRACNETLTMLHQSQGSQRGAGRPPMMGVCSRGRADGIFSSTQDLRCLKHMRRTLPQPCAAEVTRVMMEESKDVSLDVTLHRSCEAELRTECALLGGGEGKRRKCLERLQMHHPEKARARDPAARRRAARPCHARCAHATPLSTLPAARRR